MAGRFMYHWAPRSERESIRARGLLSAVAQGDPDGWWTVFLAELDDECIVTLDPEVEDLWQVETTGLILEPDESRDMFLARGNKGGRWWQTASPVGPERLRLLDRS